MPGAIAITCPGLISPAGRGLDALLAAMYSRTSHIGSEEFALNGHTLRTPTARAEFAPADHFAPARLRRMDRLHQLGLIAARDTAAAFGAELSGNRTGVVVGSANRAVTYLEEQYTVIQDRPSRVNPLALALVMGSSLTGHVATEFGITGPSMTVNAECATGLAVLIAACDWIQLGHADQVIVGGADATIAFSAIAMFRRMGALSKPEAGEAASMPFDRQRSGFVMGEGAAFAIVEPAERALAAGRDILGLVLGHALRTDISHLIAPDPSGQAQERVVRAAIEHAGMDAHDVCSANAHATSTPANDVVEANAIASVIGLDKPITAVKGVTGHMFGASGLAEAFVACHSASTGSVPPVVGLSDPDPEVDARLAIEELAVPPGPVVSTSFGFGGHDACVVVDVIR